MKTEGLTMNAEGRRDSILAIVVALCALGYLYVDAQLPDVASGDPVGPRIYPALIGMGMLGSALAQLFDAYRKRTLGGSPSEKTPGAERRYLLIGFVAVWTLAYYATLEWLGYLSSTTIFIFGLLIYFNPKMHLVNAAIAIGFSVFIYALFTKFLLVELPHGLFGF
jgi:putative tricarboxylic transport membrane protein